MSQNNRPNYFILLDLDPNKPWSEEEFKQVLKKKKAEWTKLRNHPTKKREVQKYLGMIPDIETTMKEPQKRKDEAKEAIEAKSTGNKQKEELFNQDFKLLTIKGYITENEIYQLINGYSSIVSDKQLRKKLIDIEISIRDEPLDKKEKKATLKQSTMKEIDAELKIIGKKDLYDFLELTKSARTSDLEQKASEFYKTYIKNPNKNNAEVSANMKLAGMARTCFKDENERAKYNRALAEKAFSILDKFISKLAKREEKKIYAQEFDYLLELALSNGLDEKESEKYIYKVAEDKGLRIQGGAVETVKQKIRCLSCDRLNEKNYEFCIECNAPLKVTCPKCNKVSPIENRACQCSFPIGNATDVRKLIAESGSLITEKNFEEAVSKLQYASQLWNTIPPVKLNDRLTQNIEQYLQQAQKNQQQQQTLQSQLARAIQDRRFYEARYLLSKLKAYTKQTFTSESHTIERAIKQAETDLDKVRGSNLSGERAIAIYQEVLRNCKDCQPALEALAKTPPAPPSNLQASVGNGLVSLNWQTSSAKNIKYTIIRKYNSRPVSSKDGQSLATVAGTHYDDAKPTTGVPIYYAVYTNREGTLSASAAILNTPVLARSEVENPLKQISDRQINLQWTPPSNAVAVKVVRNKTRPRNPDDGEVVKVLNKSQVVDRNLQNGTTYHYAIYAIFHDHRGKPIASDGIYIEAIPEEPPVAPKLKIEPIGTDTQQELRLSWTPVSKGEVGVLMSNNSPELAAEQILPENKLAQMGKLIIGKGNRAIAKSNNARMIYFTSIVLFQGIAYVGETISYSNLENISNLKAQKQTNALNLYWDWPKSCQKAVVAYSHTDFPTSPNSPGVNSHHITKAQYELHGYYALKNPAQQDYYFTVFAVSEHDGKTLTASGTTASARFRVSYQGNLNLHYEIKRQQKLWGKKKLNLILKVSGSGELPALILVQKSGTQPLRKEDGRKILHIPSQRLSETNANLSFPLEDCQTGYGKLFLEDDSLYDSKGGYVHIYHAVEKTKI